MTTTTISPFVVGGVSEVELSDDKGVKKKFWKKQILPSGTRKYKGETLDFTKINPACVKAFEDEAAGAVPFVLAMPDNTHPKRGQELETLEGDLHKLELADDGSLVGYFDLSNSEKVQNLIKKSNNKLGVSGSIEVDYKREDIGKSWDYALTHVCGTTGPHVKGLSPWESVELSEEEKHSITIDFSDEVIDTDSDTNVKKAGDGEKVTVEVDKAQWDKVVAFMGEVEAATKDLEGSGGEGGNGKEKVTLSEEDKARDKRIELAEANARKGYELAERAQIELAESRWETRSAALVREGVPPVILTEAAKVLKLHKRPTIKLSETESVDAAEVIENILDACKGTIKLSVESGHSVTDTGKDSLDKEYEEFAENFFQDFE